MAGCKPWPQEKSKDMGSDLGMHVLTYWCLCSRKCTQMYMREMTENSYQPAEDKECLSRSWKAEQVGRISWPNFATSFLLWGCTKVLLVSQIDFAKIFSSLVPMWSQWHLRTIKTPQVTPLEHSSSHQGLWGIIKGLFPIPECWCSLTTRCGPFSSSQWKQRRKTKNLSHLPLSIPQPSPPTWDAFLSTMQIALKV